MKVFSREICYLLQRIPAEKTGGVWCDTGKSKTHNIRKGERTLVNAINKTKEIGIRAGFAIRQNTSHTQSICHGVSPVARTQSYFTDRI